MSATPMDHDHLAHALAEGLHQLNGRQWTPAGDGSIRSEGTLAVFIANLHGDVEPHPGHVDIGFVYNIEREDTPVLWDCAAGAGNHPSEVAEWAARIWLQTTASTLLEVMEGRGRLASHHDSGSPGGLPGKHVVQGPALAFGSGDTAPLLDWAVDDFVLAELQATLLPRLPNDLHGVKLLFGGTAGDEIAEVRVDHAYDEASSAILARLPWPRLERPGYVRTYLVVLNQHD